MTPSNLDLNLNALSRERLHALYALVTDLLAYADIGSADYRYLSSLLTQIERRLFHRRDTAPCP